MKVNKDLETKVDLLFSVQANQYLANQALQVFQSIQDNIEDAEKEGGNPESLKKVMEKAMESYKHHSEGVNDAITYYYELFGESANANILSLLEAKGINVGADNEPSPVSEVKASKSSKSEKGKK